MERIIRRRRRQAAFTVVELVVVLAVISLVTSLAIPALRDLLLRSRMTVVVNTLVSELALARSEAIKRGARVTACQSSDGASCTGGGAWHEGYIVFVDLDKDRTVDPGEDILRVNSGFKTDVRYNGSLNHDYYIRYEPSGRAYPNGTFSICDARGSSGARSIIVLGTGRVRTSNKTGSGAAISCPTT